MISAIQKGLVVHVFLEESSLPDCAFMVTVHYDKPLTSSGELGRHTVISGSSLSFEKACQNLISSETLDLLAYA
jgi:hypothetical protein